MKMLWNLMLALTLVASLPATAQNYDIQGVAALEILPGYRTKRGTHMTAVRFRLKDGWKTYWRTPGGNGIPPQFQWSGSKNLAGVAFHWPAPNVYVEGGIRTIGYKHELVLPIELKPRDVNAPITVKGRVEFGVCSDVCIPASGDFSAVLQKGRSVGKSVIHQALSAGPLNAHQGGVKSTQCSVKPIESGFRITSVVTLKKPAQNGTLSVLEYRNPDVWADSGKTVIAGNTLTTETDLYTFTDAPLALDRSKFRLTLLGRKAVEISGCKG